jgi:hypothetical protein
MRRGPVVGCTGGGLEREYILAVPDDVVEIAAGTMARDEFLTRNGCSTETVADGPCEVHQGCDADNPVVWCEFDGGHSPPDFAPTRTWEFFASF